jgi:hypothetical protein
LHEDRRRNNWDVAKGTEREQIGVAGNDQIRMAIDGQFEKFIICGIMAHHKPFDDCHRFRHRQQPLQPGMRGRSDERDKIRPGRNVEQLPLGCSRFKQDTALLDDMHSQRWQGLVFQDRAYKNVRVAIRRGLDQRGSAGVKAK